MSLAIICLCLYQVHLFHIISACLILQPLILPSVEYQLEPAQRLKVSKTHISVTMIILTIFTCCSSELFFSLTALPAIILGNSSVILENFSPEKQLLQSLLHGHIYYMPGRLFQMRVTKKQYNPHRSDFSPILSHMSVWWIEKRFRALTSTEVIDGRWAIHQIHFFTLWPGPSHAICQKRHWSLFGRVWEQKWVQTGMSSVIQSNHSSDAFVYKDRIRNEAQTHRGK